MAGPPSRRAVRLADGRSLIRRWLPFALLFVALIGWAPCAFADDGESEGETWRARGLAHVDLPLRFRARVDTTCMRHPTMADQLTWRFQGAFGPQLLIDPALETRVSISQPLSEGIELEIAWQTRNVLTVGDPLAFDRQIVGAFLRFAH